MSKNKKEETKPAAPPKAEAPELPKVEAIGVAHVEGKGSVPFRVTIQGDRVLSAEILGGAKPTSAASAANVGLLVLEAGALTTAEAVLAAKVAFMQAFVLPSVA